MRFGPVDPGAVETAGPEVSFDADWTQARWVRRPMLNVAATAGPAWLPGAPRLARPSAAFQPYGLVTVGVGR